MLDKPLDKLVKYYMCSDHFESDCYHDPDTKTRLKKNNSRPVVVPVPTIFQCNLSNVVGQNVVLTPPVPAPAATPPPPPPPKRPRMTQVVAVEDTLENFTSTFTVTIPATVKRKKKKVVIWEQVSEAPAEEMLCRLCNKNMDPNDPIILIFEEDSIVEALDEVLPGEIQEGDDFSPVICKECKEDLSTASQILAKFRSTQDYLKSRELQQ